MIRHVLTLAGYFWAFPNTLLGLAFLLPALITGGGVRVERGAIEIYGGFARFFLPAMCRNSRGKSAMKLMPRATRLLTFWGCL